MEYLFKLESEELKKWYKDNNASDLALNSIARYATSKGYTLDPKSGLFLKPHFSEEVIEKIDRTFIDVLFPRPSDIHYHKDVTEFVRVIGGGGSYFYIDPDVDPDFHSGEHYTKICLDEQIGIPKGIIHGFCPPKNSWLEISVVCDGILDPKKEICVTPFNEFEPWTEIWK